MDIFKQRKYFIQILFILVSIIYIIRLFALQVIDTSYKVSASNNVLRYVTQYPARGLIFDRNGELLVYNQAAYDLMIVPRQLEAFDTTSFCKIINISKQQLVEKITKAKNYSYLKPSLFLKQMSSITYAKLQEKLYKFHGFFVQTRTLRKYPKKIAAHSLGYVGEVDDNTTKKNSYYKLGDYIGISGIEKSYEKDLRGKKGVEIFLVDVHNRIKGKYKKGRYDTIAIAGANITTTLDASLQKYGEKLMQNKKGSIVAIEPSTGEILTMVTSPSYNPDLLVGRIRTQNYLKLLKDTLKPLFNRAVMAKYPPGSTFKIITALIGLQEKVLYQSTQYSCHGGYRSGRTTVGCHIHPSPLDLTHAVQYSCNAYFCNVYRSIIDNPEFASAEEGFQVWRDYVTSFGFGNKLGLDLPNELSGNIPTTKYYDKYYGNSHWSSLTTISLSIGQGELGITPLQMANMTSTVANRGFYYTPHIVKNISNKKNIDPQFLVKHYTKIDSSYFPIVIEGMDSVINGGAGSTARIAKIKDITVCGKTGTAQNPHGDNHSIFIAFAPKDKPKIAVAVFIENGGYGARWAAPTASLIIEKYLKKEISRKWLENYILNCDLINVQTQDKHME
ncbi:MAG: penicillin-binding protein 2 [Bacteroidetes bacterium]|nr:MAG: penicillin-binding protein 2 [Bacteroidota bacterium]